MKGRSTQTLKVLVDGGMNRESTEDEEMNRESIEDGGMNREHRGWRDE